MRQKLVTGKRRVINENGSEVAIRVRCYDADKKKFQKICKERMWNPSEVMRRLMKRFVEAQKNGGNSL
jgi:hypothetical protein